MKKIHNILAVAAIALTFTACSSDNDNSAESGKEYPISLSVGISDLSVVTRATTELKSGELGLYITSNGEKTLEGKYLCNNEKFTYGSSEWTCASDKTYYWAADNATINYIAYHPYQSSISTDKSISWDVKTQSGENVNLDLLYVNSSATNSATDHSIDITLGHVCSKLVVNVSKLGSEIASGTKITSIKIGGLKPKGTFSLTDKTWNSSNETAADIGMVKSTTSTTTTSDIPATYEAILIPQEASFTLTISLSNNSEYQLAVPSQAFAAGTCYSLTIQVGQDNVTLGSITQTDWVPGNGDGDTLTAQ